MTKICAAVLAFLAVTPGMPVMAHGCPQQTTQDQKAPELADIKGTVRSDDAKITFVADEGGKSWDVVNPETLKDRVGQHLNISAHVYPDKNQIHVVNVVKL